MAKKENKAKKPAKKESKPRKMVSEIAVELPGEKPARAAKASLPGSRARTVGKAVPGEKPKKAYKVEKPPKVFPPGLVVKVANQIVKKLSPYCDKVEIAGSIRRKKPEPYDIDIVLIASDLDAVHRVIRSFDDKVRWGEKLISILTKEGIKVDFSFSAPDEWGAMLMTYTGPWQYNMWYRTKAKKKGWLLNQYGLFDACGKKIAGKTEESIYHALDKEWKEPESRGSD